MLRYCRTFHALGPESFPSQSTLVRLVPPGGRFSLLISSISGTSHSSSNAVSSSFSTKVASVAHAVRSDVSMSTFLDSMIILGTMIPKKISLMIVKTTTWKTGIGMVLTGVLMGDRPRARCMTSRRLGREIGGLERRRGRRRRSVVRRRGTGGGRRKLRGNMLSTSPALPLLAPNVLMSRSELGVIMNHDLYLHARIYTNTMHPTSGLESVVPMCCCSSHSCITNLLSLYSNPLVSPKVLSERCALDFARTVCNVRHMYYTKSKRR